MLIHRENANVATCSQEASGQALVACDDEALGMRVRDLLLKSRIECPLHGVVPMELAADRASRIVPAVTVVVLTRQSPSVQRSLHDLSQTIDTHTLVVGPTHDPQLIMQTLRAGADEYLDENLLEEELSGAIGRFNSRKSSKLTNQETGKVIAVLAPSGGSGSSTIAANVSTVLAKKHEAAGLIDLRLPAGDLASLLDVHPKYTAADLCENLDRLDRAMFEQFLAKHPSGVHLLASPRSIADVAKVTPKGIRQALLIARSLFPYVVIDLDNAFSEEQIEAMWQASVIVFVLRLDYTSLRNARLVMEHLKELGLGLDRVRPVVNRYGERKQLRLAEAERALGVKIANHIPDDPTSVNAAINAGVPVVLQRPRSHVSRRLAELAASVNGHHGRLPN
jgi:pilus assembly protein CpaE